MPYSEEYHECFGVPYVEYRYTPSREEYDEYVTELKEGRTARDEVNFFGFVDHPVNHQVMDIESEEFQDLTCHYGYTGAEW